MRAYRVFRAEPSFTSRHATEFTGIDIELGWISDVEDVMAFEEQMLAHAISAVADRHGKAVPVVVPRTPFPRITMAEAHAIVRAQGWDPAVHARLTRTNWWRTAAWTLGGVTALVMLGLASLGLSS